MSPSKSKTAPVDNAQAVPDSFEEAVAELEALVNTMDSQNLGLDQLLTDYKRGAYLVKYCRDRLSQVRKEVTEIEQTLNKPADEGAQ
ncbi:MAG: exodeoxyribonuclease VII small subunit [Betaproteobacteria bacterium]|jgi:exodeoxyribonuclease VII small subunit|nr:MAG: exodeoxyribonuclease VII small subunit [Betaproteobacteria bacterium]PZO21281.1 MAG: exodeoxyribonuclease VII small subunit [Betaproteobacteria bacterium]PZO26536.1 MAG: exodeoxyribonuclease VII small subunit [Betaproteobacteria bacterium]